MHKPDMAHGAFGCDVIDSYINAGRIPGFVAAAYRGGTLTICSKGFKSKSENLSAHTRFPLGCLSKLLVSLLALRLVEEKELSLDWEIKSILSEIKRSNITVGDILGQSVGYKEKIGSRWDARWDDLVESLEHDPIFEPGSMFSYTQSSSVPLVVALERMFSRPISHLLNEYVGDELGIPRFDETMSPVPHPDDATLFLRHGRTRRLMPFRLPKDTGVLRYSMSGYTVSVPELIRIGRLALRLIRTFGGPSQIYAGVPEVGLMAGADSAEQVSNRWALGVGDFGSVIGHTGSYIASTAGIYLDFNTDSAHAVAMNTWDPELRQKLLHSMLADSGIEPPNPCSRRLGTRFKVADLVGNHVPIMYGLGPLSISNDGTISGAFTGRISEQEDGLVLDTEEKVLSIGVEEIRESGKPLIRLASSVCIKA